jgi:hypothetical protein
MTRFVLAALAAFALVVPAQADCIQAKQRVAEAVDTHDQWTILAIEEATDGKETDFDFNYFVRCQTMVPVAKERLRYVEEILELNEEAHRICETEDTGELIVGGYPAMSTRAMLKEYVAVCAAGEGDR